MRPKPTSPTLAEVRASLKKERALRTAAEQRCEEANKSHAIRLQKSQLKHEQMRHLTHQIILSQEEERREISRELHDDVAQTLTAVNVHLAALTAGGPLQKKPLKAKIKVIHQLVEKSFDVVHRFARELRPTLLDDLGLIPALHSYLKEFCKGTTMHVGFTAYAGVENLSNARRTVLYRVAQSALTNIAQHAQATAVKVEIQKIKRSISMTIHDNGRSFAVRPILAGSHQKHLGLIGMRERVEMVGGRFHVESAPGMGTTVSVQVPLDYTQSGKPRKSAHVAPESQ